MSFKTFLHSHAGILSAIGSLLEEMIGFLPIDNQDKTRLHGIAGQVSTAANDVRAVAETVSETAPAVEAAVSHETIKSILEQALPALVPVLVEQVAARLTGDTSAANADASQPGTTGDQPNTGV